MDLNNSSHATLKGTPALAAHTAITLYSVLLVWSLLGNVLVIAVVYCNQTLRTNMNYLIVNMAVSDLLVPLVAMPWEIFIKTVRPNEWLVDGPIGEALCKMLHFLSEMSLFVSSISLVIIAFQRFIVVVYPTRRQVLTPKAKWLLRSVPWIIAMVLLSPNFYTARLTNELGYTMCIRSWSPAFEHWRAQMIFISITGIVGFIIPLITIIVLYSIIQSKLRKSLKNVIKLIDIKTIRSRQRRDRKIFRMSITTVVLFAICWSPLGTLHLLLSIQHPLIVSMDRDTLTQIRFAFPYLWFLQAAINPCIYFLFLRDFRQGLKRLCCCKGISGYIQIYKLCVCCLSTVAPGGESNQDPSPHIISTAPDGINIDTRCTRTPSGESNLDPTCTLPHINTTSI